MRPRCTVPTPNSALATDFVLEPDVAVDGIEEWLELGSLPFTSISTRGCASYRAPAARVDCARWTWTGHGLVDLTGDSIAWRCEPRTTAVCLDGAATDLLLVIYKRRSPVAPYVRITGDRDLLDFWLARVDFG